MVEPYMQERNETVPEVGTIGNSVKTSANRDKPTFTIRSSKAWDGPQLREIWKHRELLYFLAWRDLKVRYKQTILGFAWVVLQPLLFTLVFTVVLRVLVKVPSDGIPYPIFAYIGLLIWTFFSSSVLSAANSLVGNANLISKVYFPRMLIPLACVLARLVDLFVALSIIIGLLAYYRIHVTAALLLAPYLILLLAIFSLSVGMWSAAINVKYRDVGLTIPVMIQLWMFLSPVAYPASLVPSKWRLLYSVNPLVGMIEGFRATILGQVINWPSILMSTAITLLALAYATFCFRNRERRFADLV
jgi:lipopolysaccharide transport system permease protein